MNNVNDTAERIIAASTCIRILADEDEPWRCWLQTRDKFGDEWKTVDNPRLSEMANISLTILKESLEEQQR